VISQFVLITHDDGSVSVMQLVLDDGRPDGVRQDNSDEVIEMEIDRAGHTKPVASWRRIDPATLPQDRTFRDAWRDEGGQVRPNLAAAKIYVRFRFRKVIRTDATLDTRITDATTLLQLRGIVQDMRAIEDDL
jgi:hypothetical protein